MSLGEERNLPESSNLVGLHITGLFLFQVSSRRKRQTSQGVKEKKTLNRNYSFVCDRGMVASMADLWKGLASHRLWLAEGAG